MLGIKVEHVFLQFINLLQELSPHALYMRLKRICGRTSAGKLQVSEEVHKQYQEGDRDQLAYALVRALKTHGYDDRKATRDAVRVWWFEKLLVGWDQICFQCFFLLIRKKDG